MVPNMNRTRGYKYERTLTDRIDNLSNWRAWRLGAPQVHLPDILAVNNDTSTVVAIECKSTTTEYKAPVVPKDQILRCHDVVMSLAVYRNRHTMLAFQFPKKQEYLCLIPHPHDIQLDMTCNKSGFVHMIRHKTRFDTITFDEYFKNHAINMHKFYSF